MRMRLTVLLALALVADVCLAICLLLAGFGQGAAQTGSLPNQPPGAAPSPSVPAHATLKAEY